MRISDWRSDVCSADLEAAEPWRVEHRLRQDQAIGHHDGGIGLERGKFGLGFCRLQRDRMAGGQAMALGRRLDRKSVLEGKSVSVRVDLGGRRILQKQNE